MSSASPFSTTWLSPGYTMFIHPWRTSTPRLFHGVSKQPTSSITDGMKSSEKIRRMFPGSELTLGRGFFMVLLEMSAASSNLTLTYIKGVSRSIDSRRDQQKRHTNDSVAPPGNSRLSSPSSSSNSAPLSSA